MKTTTTLPEGYQEIEHIHFASQKTLYRGLNIASFLIAVVLIVLGWQYVPLSVMMQDGIKGYYLMVVLLLVAIFAYFALHELTHGVLMRAASGVRPRYGFTKGFLYAGCDAYFCRRHYLLIALAPAVLWGAVLAVVCALVPDKWFWVCYAVQIMNVSGAAGDFYMTYKVLRAPKGVLIFDTGVSFTLYRPEE